MWWPEYPKFLTYLKRPIHTSDNPMFWPMFIIELAVKGQVGPTLDISKQIWTDYNLFPLKTHTLYLKLTIICIQNCYGRFRTLLFPALSFSTYCLVTLQKWSVLVSEVFHLRCWPPYSDTGTDRISNATVNKKKSFLPSSPPPGLNPTDRSQWGATWEGTKAGDSGARREDKNKKSMWLFPVSAMIFAFQSFPANKLL